jgi:hypothetical protein
MRVEPCPERRLELVAEALVVEVGQVVVVEVSIDRCVKSAMSI